VDLNYPELTEWLRSRLPATVAANDPEISVDDDEILIVLRLDITGLSGEGEARTRAEHEMIQRRRDETKETRVHIGRRLGRRYGRAVSWGMRAGETMDLFTNNTAPVMTRLAREERQVLDTLIAARVANTRSAALGYIVRAFAVEHQDWLSEVRETMAHVNNLRDKLHTERRDGPPPMESPSVQTPPAQTASGEETPII
jgi:hypothetical protein